MKLRLPLALKALLCSVFSSTVLCASDTWTGSQPSSESITIAGLAPQAEEEPEQYWNHLMALQSGITLLRASETTVITETTGVVTPLTGPLTLAAGETWTVTANANGSASNFLFIDQVVTGTGTIELTLANFAGTGDATTRYGLDVGDDFEGKVVIKNGVLTLNTRSETEMDVNLGKGTLVLEDGTGIFLKNMRGSSSAFQGGDFTNDVIVEGSVTIHSTSNTNTLLSGAFTGDGNSRISTAGANQMIAFSGDWSGYGGYLNHTTGRLLFDTDGFMYFSGITNSGYGIRFLSGSVILGAEGITGDVAMRIGTDGTGPSSLQNLEGVATMGGVDSYTINISSQGIYLCTLNSVLTFNTDRWDPASKDFIAGEGIDITLKTQIIHAVNSANGRLVKTGSGTLIFSENFSWTRPLEIQQGDIMFDVSSDTTSAYSGVITTNGGGVVKTGAGTTNLSAANLLTNLTLDVREGLLNLTGANNFAGTLTKVGSVAVGLSGANTFTDVTLAVNEGAMDLTGANTFEDGLEKTGAGTANLSGNNTFNNGDLVVTQGNLYLAGTNTFTNSNVIINGGVLGIMNNASLGSLTSISSSGNSSMILRDDVNLDLNVAAGSTLTLYGRSTFTTGTGNLAAWELTGEIGLNTTGNLGLNNVKYTVGTGESLTGNNLMIYLNSVLDIDGGEVTFTTSVANNDNMVLGASGTTGAMTTTAHVNVGNGGIFSTPNTRIQLGIWRTAGIMAINDGGTVRTQGVQLVGTRSELNINGGILEIGARGIGINNTGDGRSSHALIPKVNFNSGTLRVTANSNYSLSGTATDPSWDAQGYFTFGGDDTTTRTFDIAQDVTFNMNAVAAGDGGFVKEGAGALTFAVDNLLGGTIESKAGTMTMSGNNTFTDAHLLLNGGTVYLTGDNTFDSDSSVELRGGLLGVMSEALNGITKIDVTGNASMILRSDTAIDFNVSAGQTLTLYGRSNFTTGSSNRTLREVTGTIDLNTTGNLILDNVRYTLGTGESLIGNSILTSLGGILDVDGGEAVFTTSAASDTSMVIGSSGLGVNTNSYLYVGNGGSFSAPNTRIQLGLWLSAGILELNEGGTVTGTGLYLVGVRSRLDLNGGSLEIGNTGIRITNTGGNRDSYAVIPKVNFNSGAIHVASSSDYFLTGTATDPSWDAQGYFILGNEEGTDRTIDVHTGVTFTVKSLMIGDGGFIKAGAGTIKMEVDNLYTGDTVIRGGILDVTGTSSPVAHYLLDGGTLTGAEITAGQTLASTHAPDSKTTDLILDGGAVVFTADEGMFGNFTQIAVDGTLDFGSNPTTFQFVSDSSLEQGNYDLVHLASALGSSYYTNVGGVDVLNSSLYNFSGIATVGTRYTAQLVVDGTGTTISLSVTGSAGRLLWSALGSGTWEVMGAMPQPWTETTGATGGDSFYNGDWVELGDVGSGATTITHMIAVDGVVSPGNIVVSADEDRYILDTSTSGSISGTTKLEKTGEGLLEINLANDYSGGTEISGGTLVAGVADALGTGDVTLSDGTLQFVAGGLASVSSITTSGGTLKWSSGNGEDISDLFTSRNDTTLTFDTNGNDVAFDTALSATGMTYVKAGDGTLTINEVGGLKGNLEIDGGTVSLTGSGGTGRVYGNIAVNDGGTLYTNSDSFGYNGGAATSVREVVINDGGIWTQAADGANTNNNNTMGNVSLVMNGGTINGAGRIDFYGGSSSLSTLADSDSLISVAKVALRQDETEFNIAGDSSLTISGALMTTTTDSVDGDLLKSGEGLLLFTGDNTYKGKTLVDEGTLQIGSGGATGSLGQGVATIAAGASLIFNLTGNQTIDTILDGSGSVGFEGTASSFYTLDVANTLTGVINIYGGNVLLGDAGALGVGTTVNIGDGGALDYNGLSGSGQVSLMADDGAILRNVWAADHTLAILADAEVEGTGGISLATVTFASGGYMDLTGTMTVSSSLILNSANTLDITSGSLVAETLSLKDQFSRITVDGDVTVNNGGDIRLGSDNDYSDGAAALVQGQGNVSVTGFFALNVDANIGQGDHTYYLFGAGSSGTYSSIDAALAFSPGTEYLESFFDLDTSDFDTTGKVYINRLDWIVTLYDQSDIDSLGGTYTPSEANAYLGAKQEVRSGVPASQDDPVLFNIAYNVTDNAYKLTNGLGWMNFQTQMTGGDNMLLITGYFAEDNTPSVPDEEHGIIISNNNNNFGAGTRILGAHVVLDGTVAAGGLSLWPGEQNNLLGTGKVDVGGQKGILELRPGGVGDTSSHEMANDISLHDGATLIQTSGSNVLSGNIVLTGDGANIRNATTNVLSITNSLSGYAGTTLTLDGTLSSGSGKGIISLNGVTSQLDNLVLNHVQLLMSNGAYLSAESLDLDAGQEISVSGGSELALKNISSGSSLSSSLVILSGGTLTLNSSLLFNGDGQLRLRIEDSPGRAFTDAYNTLNVTGGSQVTINGLTSADGSFTKIGEGLLVLSGDSASYTGTATVGEGRMNMNASQYGGSLVAGADGTETFLAVAAGSTVGGSLIANGNATVTLGNGASVNGGLAIDNAAFTAGNDVTLGGSLLTIGEDSRVTFGRNTNIASNAPGLEVASGSSLRFGRGSSITGTLANGVTIGGGATFSGFLDAGFNDFTLSSGSVYLLTQDDLNQYGGSTVGVSSRRTITVEEGAVFQLDSGLNFTTIPVWPEGVVTLLAGEGNGTVTIDGRTVVENADYSRYLGDTDYMWYFFNLIGGDNSLFLEIRANVEFDTLAETANEKAIADTASDIAMSASRLEGEIRDLGGALAMSTTANAHYNLSQLALSTSGVMAGFTAQMENLRRHTFDILNRAVQEKPGVERLSYEQHHNTVWANGLGGSYKLKGDGNAVGNTTNVWGGTVGASTGVTENLVVGLALTYTNSDTRLDRAMGKSEADAYYVDLFGRYRKDNWTVTGVVTGGWTSLDIERDLSLEGYSSHSKSKPNGKQVMGLVQVGYEFTVSRDQNSKLEPFVLVSGGYSEIDGLSETGAGTAGLNVESQSQGLCTLGGGVRFIREYITDRDLASRGRFEARAMVLQDLTDLKPEVKGHFQGRPESRFQLEGAAPGKTAFVIGAGVVQPIGAHVSLFADVDGEFRRDENGVRGTVGLKYSF